VADIAEHQNHHPEFLSVYRKMRVRLSTHDASGLTQKDFDLAAAIDSLIASQFSHRI
jgi:4a-hydroxytetrahydrobiopterin dehydratase